MKTWKYISFPRLGKKLAAVALIGLSVAAFATLGDGKVKNTKSSKSLLSNKSQAGITSFSLRSGYEFRGNQVFSKKEERYVSLNTNLSFQKGHTTYIVPLKKRVALNNKVTFNPNAATRR